MKRLWNLVRQKRTPPPPSLPLARVLATGHGYEQLPLELRTAELFPHCDVLDLLNYCSTNRELFAFSQEERTWRSLIRRRYGHEYTGTFPRQAYALARMLDHPPVGPWRRHSGPEILRTLETFDSVIKELTTLGSWKGISYHHGQPMLMLIHPMLLTKVWMDAQGFTIGLIPRCRDYGFILINSLYQLRPNLLAPIRHFIREYQNYLSHHPVAPRVSKRQLEHDYANLADFVYFQQRLIPDYVSDLFHVSGPHRPTNLPPKTTSTRSTAAGIRKPH